MDTKISYSAIYAAFDGDHDISKYCDPSNERPTPESVSIDAHEKLLVYEEMVDGAFEVLKVGDREVGFVYYFSDVLVSFGVNKEFRNKNFLTSLFDDIKKWMGDSFVTYMWERNERAIRWFEKCGMEREDCNLDNVVKLRYKSCR
jgi:RimJ/RimL family protein N-acetyltransferase